MAQLAIKGHATRGSEVIALLEMLGGKNIYNLTGSKNIWYILSNCTIEHSTYLFEEKGFTLEEFLEKFPYKVGDKVIIKAKNQEAIIDKIVWCCNTITYWLKYDGIIEGNWRVEHLQPYKEETIKETTDKANKAVFDTNAQCCDIMNHLIMEETIKIDIPKGYEFAGVDDDNQQVVFEKIGCQYPKTYVECAKTLDCFGAAHIDGHKNELLEKLQELLICRDAYWKIAGEQMGLDKPWKPDWQNINLIKFIIVCRRNSIIKDFFEAKNVMLAFPTEEMRDAFYENFKELINDCKELL